MDNARLEELATDVTAAVVAPSPTVQMMARELLEARERLARIDEILASAEAVYVNILRGNLPMTKQNAIALAVRFGGLPDDVEARLTAYEALMELACTDRIFFHDQGGAFSRKPRFRPRYSKRSGLRKESVDAWFELREKVDELIGPPTKAKKEETHGS
jgi:hypothetical protein